MGRCRIQLLLADNTWSTRYNIPKDDQYSDLSTDWTLLSLNFTVENYGIKLIYGEISSPHANMCFSNITITHSVHYMDKINCFKSLIESIPDYRRIVLIMFLIRNDFDLIKEIGFLKNDINSLKKEFKKSLTEHNED